MQTKQKNKPLKYIGYAVVCEEVPDEISLAFNISGCPYHCEGCHSEYLWEYDGEYIGQNLTRILSELHELITCVCFLGGDQNMEELTDLCKKIKKDYGLKTCIYTGYDRTDKFLPIIEQGYLDYLKIGRYMDSLGGLNNENTNQRMYKIIYDNSWKFIDITDKFLRKKW